jgi:hypothetical protein
MHLIIWYCVLLRNITRCVRDFRGILWKPQETCVVDVNRSVRWTVVTYLVVSLLIQACQGTP